MVTLPRFIKAKETNGIQCILIVIGYLLNGIMLDGCTQQSLEQKKELS